MSDLVGRQLGNYRLIERQGAGAFAHVYRGEHLYLRTPVAIKVLKEGLPDNALADFKKEAQLISNLNHPHIVKVRDFGVEGDIAYLIMDYALNGNLRKRHPEGTQVSLQVVVGYVQQIAAALQYAHNHKVIHRDIKPENLLLDKDGKVLVSDFGIAIIYSNSRNTQDAQGFHGTPPYMAPEQYEGAVSHKSDQYALGFIVYEWLAGHWPFDNLAEKRNIQPRSLRQMNVGQPIPLSIDEVIRQALEKEPKDRHHSIQEFADKLVNAYKASFPTSSQAVPLSSLDARLPSAVSPPVPLRLGSPGPDVSIHGAITEKRPLFHRLGRRTMLGMLASGLIVLSWAGVGFDSLFGHPGNPPQTPTPTVSHTATPITPTQTPPSPTSSPTPVSPAPGSALATLPHGGAVSGVAWSPDGHFIASSAADGTVQVWDISNPKKWKKGTTYMGHRHEPGRPGVLDVAWSPDRSFDYIVSCANNQVHVWNARSGISEPIINQPKRVNAVTWWPKSTINGWLVASASDDGNVRVWHLNRGSWDFVITLPDPPITTRMSGISWSAYDQFLAACSTDTRRGAWVWDLLTPGASDNFYLSANNVISIACSPVNSLVAVGFGVGNNSNSVQIYNYRMPSTAQTPVMLMAKPLIDNTPAPGINRIAWSPDGNYVAAAASDGLVWLFDITNSIAPVPFRGHLSNNQNAQSVAVNALAWSPDGTMIASGDNSKNVLIWNTGLPPMNS